MFRRVVVVLVAIAAMCAGALGGLVLAWWFDCGSTGNMCLPTIYSFVFGPLAGFVLTGAVVGFLGNRYYRRHPRQSGAGDHTA